MVNLASIVFGAVISCGLYYSGYTIVLEILLPILYLYHILTFSLAYPNSHQLRRLFVSFSLSFADILITVIIFQKSYPEKLWFWISEFFVVYVMVANLTHKEIEIGLAGKNLRMVIYTVAGYLKAVSLVSSLVYLERNCSAKEMKGFIVHVLVGMCKLCSTIAVYYIDRIFCCNGSFDKVTLTGVSRRLKLSLMLVCLVIEICVVLPTDVNDYIYDPNASVIHLVAVAYMVSWYLTEAHEYGIQLRQN